MIRLGAFFCYQILATFGVLVVQGAEFPKKAELSYSSWELSRVVQKAGIERMRVKSVTRNSEGTLLFVSGAGRRTHRKQCGCDCIQRGCSVTTSSTARYLE
jgi:hypothetical protein